LVIVALQRRKVDREGNSYYYLPLTPRMSLPSLSQSAVQVSMSIGWRDAGTVQNGEA